jgi:hypothetical protein
LNVARWRARFIANVATGIINELFGLGVCRIEVADGLVQITGQIVMLASMVGQVLLK